MATIQSSLGQLDSYLLEPTYVGELAVYLLGMVDMVRPGYAPSDFVSLIGLA
jgi:hypothetical protein